MRFSKRILSLLLVLTMVLTVCPLSLFAAAEEPEAEYEIAQSVAVGDKIIVVAAYEEGYYALTNDASTVSNALYGTQVAIDESGLQIGEADVIWEVAAGAAEGAFILKNKDGLAISYGGSGTGVSLSENGAGLLITPGEGVSVLEYTGNSSRHIFFRMNNEQPQFRMYSTNNANASGYSSVLTIYKVIEEAPAPENVAPKATASSATCASWNKVSGVNDGVVPAQSYGNQAGDYGSWGQNSACNPEYITLTWNTEVELVGAGMYFWHDNGKDNRTGIDFPVAYTFEYLAADGETWNAVPEAAGMAVDEDVMNQTTFGAVTTKGLRVVMEKEPADDNSYGLGVAEFEAYGQLLALDTAALEQAIAAAEAVTNLDNYTEETVAALTEALAAARAVLENPASQAAIDEAAQALMAAVNGLVIKPVEKPAEANIAPQGAAAASYCASWNNVSGVNDGNVPAQSNGNQAGAYGSWGQNNNANPEPITITFPEEATITGAGLYFWEDDGKDNQSGIDFPASYSFEYLDADGVTWVPVENARGMNNLADEMNYSVFTPVATTAFRVLLVKSSTGSFGLGVAEFEIYGSFAAAAVDTAALEAAIAAAQAVDPSLYTEETVAAMNEALAAAQAVLEKEDKTQEEVDAAAAALNAAVEALELKPEEPPEVPVYRLTALADLKDGEKYVIVLWRYFNGTNADSKNGYVLNGNSNLCGGVRAAAAEDYSTITYTEGTYPDANLWNISAVEGGWAIRNVSTGKYLGNAVPAASDEPVALQIATGAVNGVTDYAIGYDASHYLRYSGTSDAFSWSSGTLSSAPNGTNACNVLFYKVVDGDEPAPVVDTAALEAAIAAAQAVDPSLYTEETVAAMNEALAAAQAVLEKEDKTQEEVDAAAAALNAAVEALELKPEEPALPTYELTALEDLKDGEKYVIVLWRYFNGTNADSKNGYVLNGNSNLCGGVRAAAAEDYSTITYTEGTYPDANLWNISAVEGGWAIRNVSTGKYLGNAVPAASDEPVALQIATGAVNGVTDYAIGYDANHYLRYSGSSDAFSWSSGALSSAPNGTNACNVLFYKVVVEETPMEPVQIFTGSDIQGSNDWNKHLDNIARNAYNAGHDITLSFWCGDYADGSVYADGSDTSATETPQRIAYIKSILGQYWPSLSDYHFAQGNHDGSMHIGSVIDETGPKEYDEFVLYQINEDDFPWWQAGYSTYSSEDTCLEKINATTTALGAYLDGLIAAGDQRVIFIYTHVPLHWTSRTTTYNSWWSDNIHADILFNMLNEKAKDIDIVFLYGHNHSENYADAYPDGGTVNFFAPGDEIRIPNGVVAAGGNYTTEIINFTYLNAGYVGQTASGFNPSVATASVITVKSDRVEFSRYSDTGHYEGSDRVLLRNNREELPVYMNLTSVENPKVRKEGDVEHFFANLKNAEGTAYVWTVEGNGEITEGQGTDTVAVTYTGGDDVVIHVAVSYVDSAGETQTLEQTLTVTVKAAPQAGATTYTEVKSIGDFAEGKKYAVVAWRYFGGSNDETFNGYGFGADNAVAYRAPTDDNYETIAPEGALPDTALWYIVPVEGGVTLQNVGTGKYLGSDIPAASDEPFTLTIAEGECSGVYNMAIGTASGSIRYSNSSATFGYSSTAPAEEVVRAWAANLTVYEVVTPKVYTNIAPQGVASSDFCASWSSVEGVNDEIIPDSSNPGYDYNEAYGSWGKNSNSNPETILITFDQPAKIFAAGAFFWYNADGPHNQNGIDIPASYTWEYQNEAGEWLPVPNAVGMGIAEDVMNVTDFDPIVTYVLRINMTKSTTGNYGLGVAELEIYGEFVEPVDTSALIAAIEAAEAVDPEPYTEESLAALAEALEAAQAVLANIDKTQAEVDAAAEALNAAIAALQEKPLPNIAPEAISVEAPYCASWNNLAGVNDGVIPTASNTAGDNTAYGSWRSNATADPEYITFTFQKPAEIKGAGAYFLYNENSPHEQYGVDFPDAYTYEYLNVAGEWVEVPNAQGCGLEENILNPTSFDPIVTTAFRIVMQRQAGSFGLGVGEIEIYGEYVTVYVDRTVLVEAIAAAEALNEADYTPESWAALAEALSAGKTVLADEEATQEQVDQAAAAIQAAIEALVDKVQVVIDLIDAIEEPIDLEDEEAIAAAREAYEALTEEEKARVTNYADLLNAEIAYYNALSEQALNMAKNAAISALQIYEAHAAQGHSEGKVADAEAALAEAIAAIQAAGSAEEIRAAVEAGIAAINEALIEDEEPFRFDDVNDEDAFYFDAVYWAYYHDPQIAAGVSATLFGTESTVTREQAMTFLWAAAGCPEPAITENPFTDVSETGYAYKAILWAVGEGITTGTSATTFGRKLTCTKEQILTFIYIFRGQPELAEDVENPFTDVKETSYSRSAILWAYTNGIAEAEEETVFGRKSPCTRAVIVTYLYRIFTGEGLAQ